MRIPRLCQIEEWLWLTFSINTNGLIPRPMIVKIMPPINSHFQAIIRHVNKIKDGI